MLIHSTFKIKFSNKEPETVDRAYKIEGDGCMEPVLNKTEIDSLL